MLCRILPSGQWLMCKIFLDYSGQPSKYKKIKWTTYRAPNIDRCTPKSWPWPWPLTLTPTFDLDLKATVTVMQKHYFFGIWPWPTTLTYNSNLGQGLNAKNQGPKCQTVQQEQHGQAHKRTGGRTDRPSLSSSRWQSIIKKLPWTVNESKGCLWSLNGYQKEY